MIDKLIRIITKWATTRDRKLVIMNRVDDAPYLERYYILFKNRPTWFPFNVFLHKFCSSDPEDLHDHPWPYFTLILKGGYWEHTPEGKLWRRPGHFRFCQAHSLHRITLAESSSVEVWTLFIPGKKFRDWGFIFNGRWMYWEAYIEMKRKEAMSND